jgi:glutaredoxin
MQKLTKVEIYYEAKCKHCKYLLRTHPSKKAVFRCAVDNKHITSATKACQHFEL